MSKVSVIIAAYNVEEYIREAVNSVIAQTLKDIDIVIVDDCSTDKTYEIVSEYAKHDERIKLVRNEVNSGLVRVRQTGLKNSCGEYVLFLDGDDSLAPNACERAYEAITKEKVEMLRFELDFLFYPPVSVETAKTIEKDVRKDMRSAKHKLVSSSKAGLLDKEAVGDIVDFQMWNKIYKRSLLEKAAEFLPDEYINMAEDVLYSFFIQFHARSYGYISDKLYVYRFGCGMSTVAELSEKQIASFAKMAYIHNYLKNYAKSTHSEKECEFALGRVHYKTYRSIAGVYVWRIRKENKQFFISETLKHGDIGDLILGISEHYYGNNNMPIKRIAEEFSPLDVFKSEKTEARTIGVYYFRMYNGGIEKVVSLLTDKWVKAGYKVVLFTDEEPNKDDYYINPEIKRVVVPKITTGDFFERKDRIEAFRRALIENNIDVMVYNAWESPELLLDEMTIKSCGVNLIIHTHNMFCCNADSFDVKTALHHSTLYKCFLFADTVVSISDVDTAWYNMLGLRTLKTTNPVEYDMSIDPSPLGGHNLVFVGRISWEKRTLDSIKIAELVRKEIPDVKLTIVGKGDNEDYIKQVDDYIAENELEDLVDMVGFRSDVLPYYRSADIMLSTSAFEGSPLSWLESKVFGLPLVCYELPNLDFTRDGRGMEIVPQNDIVAAARAVVKILKDDELKKEMGSQARKSAEDFISVDLAERWRNIFGESLKPKPAPLPLYELPASEAAVRIAIERYSDGIFNRAQSSKRAERDIEKIAELEDELYRFKRSESYRVGMILTFIPRKLIAILRKIFR